MPCRVIPILGASSGGGGAQSKTGFASYDFLADPARLLFNLRVGDDGFVKIPLFDIDPRGVGCRLRVVAADALNVVCRHSFVPSDEPMSAALKDMRLKRSLDCEQVSESLFSSLRSSYTPPIDLPPLLRHQHFTEQRMVSFLNPEAPLKITNLASADVALYDSLDKVHNLLSTFNRLTSTLSPSTHSLQHFPFNTFTSTH